MKDRKSFKELISGDTPILIDFYADWCGPCIAMNPTIKELANEVGNTARIVKIDVDKNAELAAKLGVMGVPTFMLFKNGKLLWKEAGVHSKEQLKQVISHNH